MTALTVGDLVEADIGPVAHGGHFVARVDGRVIFVRHALTGERVLVRITEDSGRFLRGDAVSVITASADRVEAPCRYAHPDGCGGCDFQHVSLPAQRGLKAAVVREQLQRLAGLDVEVEVEDVPHDLSGEDSAQSQGLHWRTRMQYVWLPDSRRGLRKHHSHEVVPIDECLLAAPQADDLARRPPREVITQVVGEHRFKVDAHGFWQVHPGAPAALVQAVMEMLRPRPGETALDLYAGVGLFSVFLAEAVGSGGEVLAIESDRRAAAHAVDNLGHRGWGRVQCARVDKAIGHLDTPADIVVLDPPRSGAKRKVVTAIAGLRPRAVVYVACDPAALARDVSYFAEAGYRLERLRAFDLFPMTHHVECVALLEKTGSDLR